MRNSSRLWQLAGFIFTSVFGTLLHFAYDWSGGSLFFAPFSAVNESIFEHMKLLFFPMFVFSFIQNNFSKEKPKNFWCVKLKGSFVGFTLIPLLYYTYTGILGTSADWFNITIFFIASAAAYITEAKKLNHTKPCIISETASFIILCIIGLSFIILTFCPPHIPLFQDPQSLTFGIIK
ncbi:MAG: hypothetical protein J6Q56_02030 [Clostridia bacterium]|nr:hypothetical protein [Clostridia bacterium]